MLRLIKKIVIIGGNAGVPASIVVVCTFWLSITAWPVRVIGKGREQCGYCLAACYPGEGRFELVRLLFRFIRELNGFVSLLCFLVVRIVSVLLRLCVAIAPPATSSWCSVATVIEYL